MAWKVVLIAVLLTIAPLVSADTNLLLFSDVHYDPLYGQEKGYGKCNVASSPPLGTIDCDAPAALIKSALDDMKQNAPDMPTLLAGDWQRHKYEASGLGTTAVFQPVSAWIQEMMSNTQLFAGIFGNNDFVPNYGFDYAATSHPDMAERVDAMKAATLLSDEEATQMKQCGFFSRSVNADMMVISLHTLLWTYRIQPEIPDTVADPCGQFEFFRTQVAAARAAGQTVVVLGHIPPIAKVKSIVEKGSFKSLSSDMYWKPAYQQEYASILSANKDVIVMQVYGHTHMFSLGVFDHMGGVPMVIVPAISKVYGNRPCYMIAALKPKGRLMGLRQRYMAADGTWTDGMHVGGALGFSQGFDSAEGMQQQLIDIGSHNALYTGWTNYLTLHSGGELEMATYPDSTCDSFCRALTVCAMVHDTYEPLKACVAEVRAAQGPPVDLTGSIVTTTLILVTVFGVGLILLLAKIVPMIRSGEFSFSKMMREFKEELFNEPPSKDLQSAASSSEGNDVEVPGIAYNEPAATHTHDVNADNDPAMRMFFDTEPSHFIEELPADEQLEAERIP